MWEMALDHENRSTEPRKAYSVMPFNRDEEEEDNLFDSVTAMADRMGLKGDKRATYIHDHMTQGGYQQVQTRESYTRVQQEEDEGGSDGNRWGFGGRGGGGGRNRSSRSSDNDDNF
jgi:hypothetical protein